MVKIKLLIATLILSLNVSAQSISNGAFSAGTNNGGCSPEVNRENLYGGSGNNRVAEVDQAANLCQTITGLLAIMQQNLILIKAFLITV